MDGHDPIESGFLVRYRALALRFVRGIVGSEETAEELFQEAACSIVERLQRGDLQLASGEHARNYLLRALRNLAVDRVRDPRFTTRSLEGAAPEDEGVDVPSPGPTPLQAAAALEQRELDVRRRALVEASLGALRPAEEAALRMRYGEGLTYREMSERSGDAIATLQGRVEAALGKIRRKLGRSGDLS